MQMVIGSEISSDFLTLRMPVAVISRACSSAAGARPVPSASTRATAPSSLDNIGRGEWQT